MITYFERQVARSCSVFLVNDSPIRFPQPAVSIGRYNIRFFPKTILAVVMNDEASSSLNVQKEYAVITAEVVLEI